MVIAGMVNGKWNLLKRRFITFVDRVSGWQALWNCNAAQMSGRSLA